MLQYATDEGAQPYRIWSQLAENTGDVVCHLQIQRDKIEPVVVFPVIEVLINDVGVLIELPCEEALLLGRAQCALPDKNVFVHDTDFF